ncbi:MAG: hypothetical protein KAQ75_09155, partial [Bacteroidales bacterium]|nr:hypothetical protein [Bacteroidales bacterium]
MNGILGFTELLKDSDISVDDKENYIKIIDFNGKQLLSLIDDIIDVAKIEADQLSINKTVFEINPFLEEVFKVFSEEQKRLNKESIYFSLHIPNNDQDSIFTDNLRLQQILNNLLTNAFKFTDLGSISLGYKIISKNEIHNYQFFVADTGIGITENVQSLIFERFGQDYTNKYKNQHGTGLGLAICEGLIDLLGGEIWVESTPENILKGIPGSSTFYFTIPIINNVSSNELNKLESKQKKR